MNPFDDDQEALRVTSLKHYDILDTPREPVFDRLTTLAASILDAPIAAIAFPTNDRIWFKSTVGFDLPECPHAARLDGHLFEDTSPRVLQDTLDNLKFRHHPMVKSAPYIRFYVSAPLVTPAGQPIGFLFVADTEPGRQVSDAKLARLQDLACLVMDQLELRQDRKQVQLEREKKSTLLSDLSHDLRTPMNGVLGMAELLLAADDIDDRYRRRIEIIQRSGETLLERLDEFIDHANSQSVEPELVNVPFDMHSLIQDLQETLEPRAIRKGLQLKVTNAIGAGDTFIGDPSCLGQCLSCILSHAITTIDEGCISLRVEAGAHAVGRIQLRFDVETPNLSPMTGSSLKEERQTSLDEISEAELPCLQKAKKLAETMQARIGVESLPERGSLVYFEVLLERQKEREQATVIEVRGQEDQQAGSASRAILIAEDNEDMALLIEDLILEAGHHATLAPDGASALRMLDEHNFDLVFMDGRMPDMSGFEAAERIRSLPDERAQIPIIALTGEALEGDRERYLAAGMDDYLTKPINYELLVATIERCCK